MRHRDEVVSLAELVVLGCEAVDVGSRLGVVHVEHVSGFVDRWHHDEEAIHRDGARHERATLKLKLKQRLPLQISKTMMPLRNGRCLFVTYLTFQNTMTSFRNRH